MVTCLVRLRSRTKSPKLVRKSRPSGTPTPTPTATEWSDGVVTPGLLEFPGAAVVGVVTPGLLEFSGAAVVGVVTPGLLELSEAIVVEGVQLVFSKCSVELAIVN